MYIGSSLYNGNFTHICSIWILFSFVHFSFWGAVSYLLLVFSSLNPSLNLGPSPSLSLLRNSGILYFFSLFFMGFLTSRIDVESSLFEKRNFLLGLSSF